MASRDRWIDITETKPPKGEGVLVYVPAHRFGGPDTITVAQFDYWTDGNEIRTSLHGYGFGGYEWEYDFETKDITHWRPLPQPPRKI
jgi:hypothetical protein